MNNHCKWCGKKISFKEAFCKGCQTMGFKFPSPQEEAPRNFLFNPNLFDYYDIGIISNEMSETMFLFR